MKRLISLFLVFVMVGSMLSPVPVHARTLDTSGKGVAFSEDTTFGHLLNSAIEEENTSGAALESYIRTLTVSGKTATVQLTVPRDALLVVGIFDEEEDTLFGSGVLEVTAGEEEQKVTVEIEVDTIPDYFRGKAFLLDKITYAPISQVCCYEQATKGYQDIENARATDFPEELVQNLDEDITTNFLVFREGVLRSDGARITAGENGTYTVTDATGQEKALKPGDVITATLPDGSLLIVKVASVSLQGDTVVITEDTGLEALDVFQMVKIDIDSSKYGLVEVPNEGVENMSSDGETVRVHLLNDEDPLNTNRWDVTPEGLLKFVTGKNEEYPLQLKLKTTIITQYYLNAGYTYCSARMELEFIAEADMMKVAEIEGKKKNLVHESEIICVEVPTGIGAVNALGEMRIGVELEPTAKISGKLKCTLGMEYFEGTGKFHNISTPIKAEAGTETSGGVKFTAYIGVGASLGSHHILMIAVKAKEEICLKLFQEYSTDLTEKLHVCDNCTEVKLTHKFVISGGLEILSLFRPQLDLPISEKEIGLFHMCIKHDKIPFPYELENFDLLHADWLKCPYTAWKVTMEVVDEAGAPLTNAVISLSPAQGEGQVRMYKPNYAETFDYVTELTTDEFGHAEVYLLSGSYKATVGDNTSSFAVVEKTTQVTITETDESDPTPDTRHLEIFMDSRVPLNGSVYPTVVMTDGVNSLDVTDQVVWSSDNPDIGKVESSGRDTFYACADGTVLLHATYVEDGETYVDNHEVRVYEIIDSGSAGGDTFWSFGSDYVLLISGKGNPYLTPWSAYNARIEKIIIEEGIQSVPSSSFANCVSLKEVSLPESLTAIYGLTFQNCVSLPSICIPKNVSALASNAFLGCSAKIEVDPNNLNFKVVDGMLLSYDGVKLLSVINRELTTIRVPRGVQSIEQSACAGLPVEHLELPNSLVFIGISAFEGCNRLQDITVYTPESEEPPLYYSQTFGWKAFKDCTALTKIDFPCNIQTIGLECFENCVSLESVTIPGHIIQIGQYAFQNCIALEKVVLPMQIADDSHYTYLCTGVFKGCSSLSDIRLPDGITGIWDNLFTGCYSLEQINIPETVTFIGAGAFQHTSISGIELPGYLKKIDGYAFANCSYLTEMELPDALESIGSYAFAQSGLYSMEIPNNVTVDDLDIGWFSGCKNLNSVTLGRSINKITTATFISSEISTVYINGHLTEPVNWGCFGTDTKLATIYYAYPESSWPGFMELDPYNPIFDKVVVIFGEGIVSSAVSEEPEDTPSEDSGEDSLLPDNAAQDSGIPQDPCGDDNITQGSGQQKTPETGRDNEPEEISGEPAAAEVSSEKSWYRLNLLAETTEPADGGSICVSYTDLIPGRQYLLLMLTDPAGPLVPQNLLYINQLTAGSDGTLSHRFVPRITGTDAEPVLIGAEYSGYAVEGVENAGAYDCFAVDGIPVKNLTAGISRKDGALLTGYRYLTGSSIAETPAEYASYPVSMDVWKLTFREESNTYCAEKLEDLHDILQYNGCSIRIVGVKGIRMLTSIPTQIRTTLMNQGISGYTLEEYGNVVGWKTEVEDNGGILTLDSSYAKSNYAYSRENGQDAIFANITDSATGISRIQYTNVLVNFTNEQCKQSLCMRPYMILKDADGNLVTVYGGIVTRSIGYIALQNANTFAEGTAAYDYLHNIIQYCYPTV